VSLRKANDTSVDDDSHDYNVGNLSSLSVADVDVTILAPQHVDSTTTTGSGKAEFNVVVNQSQYEPPLTSRDVIIHVIQLVCIALPPSLTNHQSRELE